MGNFSDPPPSWVMCVVNGESGVHGVDYEESSPRFRTSALWSDYMKPFKKFS